MIPGRGCSWQDRHRGSLANLKKTSYTHNAPLFPQQYRKPFSHCVCKLDQFASNKISITTLVKGHGWNKNAFLWCKFFWQQFIALARQHFQFWFQTKAGKISISAKNTRKCNHFVHFGDHQLVIDHFIIQKNNFQSDQILLGYQIWWKASLFQPWWSVRDVTPTLEASLCSLQERAFHADLLGMGLAVTGDTL